MTDSKKYSDLVGWLRGQGAHHEQHSGANLLAHLEKTYAILLAAGVEEDVRVAGLFHSVYGTSSFKTTLVPESKRHEVAQFIGPRAEQMAWLFCKLDRPRAFQLHLQSNPPSLPAHGGGELKLSENGLGELLPHLLSIEAANLLEQKVLWRNQWILKHAKDVGILSESGDSSLKPNNHHEFVMVENAKQGIYRELVLKVNAKRSTFSSLFFWGDNIRAIKLMQAQHVLGLPVDQVCDAADVPLVESYAMAYDLSIQQAAQLIFSKALEFQVALVSTEIIKDQLAGRVRRAGSMADLNVIRTDIAKI